ncbi:FEKKY domain-containing protein [Chryseobacterium taihuense]|uniref:Uncharacterized protein n=1 Tax=Chryseobacterium taihuense TaxID=1141221 RepID=A0ABY0QPH6_9FLAO|nr:hypothetical protein [Chryseobacterium taihuense]SDL43990.1 hypothetical protein SAMN05216273_101171 [Chryseobacterium taihuense]
MTKKLIIINIVILIFIFVANIVTFYGINYHIKFNISYHFPDYGFEYVLMVIFIIALVTALISTLSIKTLNYKSKFLRIFAFVNSIFLAFIIFEGISAYKMMKNEYLKLEKEYINKANLDIRNDQVTYRYAGGLTISECNQNIENKIDSINKKYGVTYFNSGCIIIEQEIKAQEKYAKIVKPYLEKRNGINWEQKMAKEIEIIKRNYK